MSLLLNSAIAAASPTTLASTATQEAQQTKWNCGGENVLKSEPQNAWILTDELRFWEDNIQPTWFDLLGIYAKFTITSAGIKRMYEHAQKGTETALMLTLAARMWISFPMAGYLVINAPLWKDLDQGRGISFEFVFSIKTNYWVL
ncbi:hypothetical protein [Mycoplasma sp. ATU-Cv-703]|uniref:hypothetical protein n=1 Tax=Mycoplasma sp. ATU-Cv-703 TaxID=2498595 RepID=UPI000FDF3DB8